MRRLARNLKPTRFSDIAAMVALFRPGPMEWINEFILGKNDPGHVRYLHPDLKPILAETYGIAVYQEQCLQIAVTIAGYTWGEADGLRRAIGKKKKTLMAKEKEKFIRQAKERGYEKEVAERIFSLVERFVGYGFNKAHSTSYAMIVYQTAWMKANYPVEFMAAMLTAESGNADKIALGVSECRRMGITVLPPSINKSGVGFTIEDHPGSLENYAVRFGLSAIKNVGKAAIVEILRARELAGEFKSLIDFCQRVDGQKINKKVLESLIRVGGLDSFGKRAAMLAGLDRLRARSESLQRQKSAGQVGLFDGDAKDNLPQIEEFSRQELLSLERDLLGFYLTEHPLAAAFSLLEGQISHKLYELSPEMVELSPRVRIGGAISSLRIIMTRDGRSEMAFAQVEDETGKIETVIFPKIFALSRSYLAKDSLVILEGRLELKEENLSLIVEKITPLSPTSQQTEDTSSFDFIIRVPARTRPKVLVELNKLLKENPGEKKGVLLFEQNGDSRRLVLTFGVNYTPEVEKKIKELLSLSSS
jgi:DNA polymerase-3 subunit alpha